MRPIRNARTALACSNGYIENGVARFSAIWDSTGYNYSVAVRDRTASQFQDDFDHWSGEGYTTRIVTGYRNVLSANYAEFWTKDCSVVRCAPPRSLTNAIPIHPVVETSQPTWLPWSVIRLRKPIMGEVGLSRRGHVSVHYGRLLAHLSGSWSARARRRSCLVSGAPEILNGLECGETSTRCHQPIGRKWWGSQRPGRAVAALRKSG
jgi:hypothetical protein